MFIMTLQHSNVLVIGPCWVVKLVSCNGALTMIPDQYSAVISRASEMEKVAGDIMYRRQMMGEVRLAENFI